MLEADRGACGEDRMKDHPKPRLVLADVDGTLVTQEKVLTEAAKAAARELRDAGVTLAITSGRPPRGMEMLIEPLALEGAISGFNGGEVVNPDLSIVESHALDPATARRALRLILDAGLDVWLYTESDWLVRDIEAPHVARERWTVKFDPKTVAVFTDAQLSQAIKIVGVSDDFERVAACERSLRETLGDRASAGRSQPYYLDVTHPLANKGAVVETLARLAHVAPCEIVTIGDMPTDVLMFRKSGFSIAMGNASDAVKAQADAVTDNNERDGFAKAMRKHVLRKAA
jgi:Cof subfamily protein (haloacid dehalogenase superfamily)